MIMTDKSWSEEVPLVVRTDDNSMNSDNDPTTTRIGFNSNAISCSIRIRSRTLLVIGVLSIGALVGYTVDEFVTRYYPPNSATSSLPENVHPLNTESEPINGKVLLSSQSTTETERAQIHETPKTESETIDEKVLLSSQSTTETETENETERAQIHETSKSITQKKNKSSRLHLADFLDEREIKRDVSDLLDFAIMGFPKCGTTFLLHYLGKYSQDTHMNDYEMCYMSKNRPDKLVRQHYKFAGSDKPQLGLKCPEDLETEFALDHYTKYFPKTKFVISVRHPVLWFQSYYNYRTYHEYPKKMPPTRDLMGPCEGKNYPYVPYWCGANCASGNMNVCTFRARFHHTLSRLGKTPLSSPEELELLGDHNMTIFKTTNKVFLMELRQLEVDNKASKSFPTDLRDFLGLKHDLKPLEPHGHSARDNEDAAKNMIDICDNEHDEVRAELVTMGRDAAEWIRNYFIKSPDVVVSSRARFIELLADWSQDPCDESQKR